MALALRTSNFDLNRINLFSSSPSHHHPFLCSYYRCLKSLCQGKWYNKKSQTFFRLKCHFRQGEAFYLIKIFAIVLKKFHFHALHCHSTQLLSLEYISYIIKAEEKQIINFLTKKEEEK